jgi:hypothetical protein
MVAVLPRMEGMKNLRADEGVLGRLLAWEAARSVTLTKPTGVGYKQFEARILWQGQMEMKATHSSFVRVGADLGVTGLCIYVGMILIGLRTVVQFKGLTETMERCRRMLFALLLTFIVSGWMIDRAYHTELFLMLGAAGAYHQISLRHRLLGTDDEELDEEGEEEDAAMEPAFGLLPVGEQAALPGGMSYAMTSSTAVSMMTDNDGAGSDWDSSGKPVLDAKSYWHRIGVIDILLGVAAGQAAITLWDYVMKNL